MNDRYPTIRHAAGAILAVLLLFDYSVDARSEGFVIVESPQTTGWPVFAIPPPPFPVTPDGETAIFFIRDPACIPPNFNLLLGFSDEAPGQCALTVHTKEWWLPEDLALIGVPWGEPFRDPNDPSALNPNFRSAVQARFDGDAVPVWVLDLADLLAAAADGVMTIGELAAIPRVEGTGKLFWVQENSSQFTSTPSMRTGHAVVLVNGDLMDGRSFSFQAQTQGAEAHHLSFVIK